MTKEQWKYKAAKAKVAELTVLSNAKKTYAPLLDASDDEWEAYGEACDAIDKATGLWQAEIDLRAAEEALIGALWRWVDTKATKSQKRQLAPLRDGGPRFLTVRAKLLDIAMRMEFEEAS